MMKTKSTLSLLAIIGIAAILLMPGQYASADTTPSPNDDFLLGTEGGDTIDGGLGNDQIFGFGSKDILDGSEGDDMILGGESSDVIRGGPGNDFLFGGPGGDKIQGGPGDDEIFGGTNGDALDGGDDNDEIYGGFNSDIIFGGPGDDIISGGPGSDNLFGEGGDDDIYGGAKNDNLFAGAGTVEATGTVTCNGPIAGDTITLNGLVYTAVTGVKADNTEFSIDGTDDDCAADLADSITNDSRTPVTVPLDQTATSGSPIVTITSEEGIQGNNVDLGANQEAILNARLILSGTTLKGDIDDRLFGGIGNDHLIGSTQGSVLLDGGEDDDDFDGFFNEDPVNFDQFGAPIDDDGDGLFNEDGPGNDNDVCFWDGGPTVLIQNPDGILNTGDELYGDDVLALDDFGDPTCETIHVLGIDPITLTGGKKGGGSKEPPQIFSAVFTETSPEDPGNPGEKDFLSGFITVTWGKEISATETKPITLDGTTIGPVGALVFQLTDGDVDFPVNNQLDVTYTLTEAHVNLLLGINLDPDLFPAINVAENLFKDKFNLGNAEQFAILTMNLVDYDSPTVSGSSYVSDTGLLTIAFDEPVDPSSVDVTLSGSGIHVREPGLSSGGIEITIPISVVAIGDTLEIITSPADQAAIDALIGVAAPASPELDVDVGAVADLSGNLIGVSTDTTIFVLIDLFDPFILSASYDSTEGFAGERLLTITFNENIDVSTIDLSKASITETGGGSAISLAGATVTNGIDGNPVLIRLTGGAGSQDEAVDLLLIPPELHVLSGAFPDLASNPSVPQTVPLALTPTDLFPPIVFGAEFDPTFGILRITFNEDVDTTPDSKFDQSLIYLSEEFTDNQRSLGGATLLTSSDDSVIELELTTSPAGGQIAFFESLTTPQLDFDANAFQDSKGNANDGTVDDDTNVTSDTTLGPPAITSVDYNSISGLLTITFDDDINLGATDLGKVFVSLENKKNQISLSGAFAAVGLTLNVVTVDTAFGGQQGAINDKINLPAGGAPHAIELDVGKNAFTDDDGSRSDRSNDNPITVT